MCPTNITLFCVSLSGYHAEGYHAPYLPPRAITPVYTSRLPHQSYHSPPIHVHRVITPAISNSYFVVFISPAFTPPLLLLHHHRAPHATTYSTIYISRAVGTAVYAAVHLQHLIYCGYMVIILIAMVQVTLLWTYYRFSSRPSSR